MDVSEIKHELGEKGHKVRNICNILNRLTKEPLSLFYVDLEPAPNNKDIYKIDRIQNAKIQFEPPHTKRDIPQCKRCQRYGHTRAYCFRPFRCVKCGENHDTAMCPKQNGVAVKCALCDGSHPANYKGCGVYQEIRRVKFPSLREKQPPPDQKSEDLLTKASSTPKSSVTLASSKPTDSFPSYAAAVNNTLNKESRNVPADAFTLIQQSFIELKQILMKQAEQTSVLLNLLSALVAKIK